MKSISYIGFLVLAICMPVHAEGGSCPAGYYPIGGQGVSGCAPIPNYGGGPQERTEARPTGVWKTTWMAIAIDSEVGDVGTSSGQQTKSGAIREAITRCKNHGATKCEAMAFHNQCAVTAWPMNVGAAAVMAGAATVELASTLALKECASKGGGICNIVTAGCSKPVFELF